jgi:drug/metabolite transporter (DMT)-like permease
MSAPRAYALLIAIVVIWAGNFPIGKLGLTQISPLTLTATRAVLALPLLLFLVARTRSWPKGLTSRDLRVFAVISLTGLVLNTTLWYWGLSLTSPINAGILGAVAPVIIAVASALWLGDRLTRANVIGSALASAAVLLTITRGSIHVVRTLSFNPGDFILFASQSAWIAYSLFARAVKSDLPPVTVQAGAYAISVAILVPLSILERPWAVLGQASWAGWLVILYAAGPITLSHIWYYQVLRVLGAARASVFMNLMPFLIIALSWALLGEPVRWYHVAGAVLVIAGVVLASGEEPPWLARAGRAAAAPAGDRPAAEAGGAEAERPLPRDDRPAAGGGAGTTRSGTAPPDPAGASRAGTPPGAGAPAPPGDAPPSGGR